jgi:hypothetical protein
MDDVTAKPLYVGLRLATLVAGIGFLYWSWLTGGGRFGKRLSRPSLEERR